MSYSNIIITYTFYYYVSPLYRGGRYIALLLTAHLLSSVLCLCVLSVQAVKHGTLTQCVVFDATLNMGQRHRRRALMIVPAGTKRLTGVGTVLAHSLRRWIGVAPALGGRISCFVVMAMGAIAQ